MPAKILIVDDDPDFVTLLGRRLKTNGYEARIAYDSIQAIKQAREQQPNLIILDINLPGGSGFEIYERLRDSIDLALVPVIFVSGFGKEGILRQAKIKEKALKAGDCFFAKPIDVAKLLDKIKELLEPPGQIRKEPKESTEEREMLRWITQSK